MNYSRNETLVYILIKMGFPFDYDALISLSRNALLEIIVNAYGVYPSNKSMDNLLRSIDSYLSGGVVPIKSRNHHIKSIAETLGTVTLPSNQSRGFYLSKWLEYVTPIEPPTGGELVDVDITLYGSGLSLSNGQYLITNDDVTNSGVGTNAFIEVKVKDGSLDDYKRVIFGGSGYVVSDTITVNSIFGVPFIEKPVLTVTEVLL